MRRATISAQFEDFDGHRSVVVRWTPTGPVRAQALFVPAFGDEMNQMRRMVRLAAEALGERSIESCIFDPCGTGDSSAGFEEATIERWLDDCRQMAGRLREASQAPLLLVGCRLGVALAVELSRMLSPSADALIGWAPVFQGRMQRSALLRAASLARSQQGNRSDGAEDEPKAQWAAGRIATLGGYPVSAALAAQLDSLDASRAPQVRSAWLFDVRMALGEGPPVPSEALRARTAAWNGEGVATELEAVEGPAFWNVADLVDVPQLVERTTQAAERALAPVHT